MHNKYATFVLPVLAGLAIVGAGFSTWVFGNEASVNPTSSIAGTIGVTDTATSIDAPKGKITVYEGTVGTPTTNFVLKLDQGGISYANDEEVGITAVHAGEGVATGGSSLETAIALGDLGFRWSIADDANKTFWTTNYSISLTYSVKASIEGSAASYIVYGGSKEDVTVDNASSTFASDGYVDVASAIDMTGTWTWQSGSKPLTLTEYNSMTSALALEGTKVSIELSLTVTYTYKG